MNRFRLEARYPGFALAAAAAWEEPRCALFGASGSGKTTLLEALVGLRPEVRGEVLLAGARRDGLAPRTRHLGWVPQDASLFPHLTAGANVRYAVEHGRGDAVEAARAVEALEIGALLERRPGELSGGERQRVAIARALAARPDFLLLDEALASVDRPLRARMLPFLRDVPERLGVPFLFVTHDPLEVAALAAHVLVLESGRVVDEGPPQGVFASAAGFGALFALGAENRFAVRVRGRGPGTRTVATGAGTRLALVLPAGFPEPERVAVRAEDVLLAAADPGAVSAQNVLQGTVEALEPVGEQLYVRLVPEGPAGAAGERWLAKVTAGAARSLGLAPGRALFWLVKAHAVLPLGEAGAGDERR